MGLTPTKWTERRKGVVIQRKFEVRRDGEKYSREYKQQMLITSSFFPFIFISWRLITLHIVVVFAIH